MLARVDLPRPTANGTLQAALAWNAGIDAPDGPFVPVRSRAQFELVLVTVEESGHRQEQRVAGALGTSQHLTVPVARGRRYTLEVRRDAADTAPSRGVAIAWRIASR